jgi:hypothetical protein
MYFAPCNWSSCEQNTFCLSLKIGLSLFQPLHATESTCIARSKCSVKFVCVLMKIYCHQVDAYYCERTALSMDTENTVTLWWKFYSLRIIIETRWNCRQSTAYLSFKRYQAWILMWVCQIWFSRFVLSPPVKLGHVNEQILVLWTLLNILFWNCFRRVSLLCISLKTPTLIHSFCLFLTSPTSFGAVHAPS